RSSGAAAPIRIADAERIARAVRTGSAFSAGAGVSRGVSHAASIGHRSICRGKVQPGPPRDHIISADRGRGNEMTEAAARDRAESYRGEAGVPDNYQPAGAIQTIIELARLPQGPSQTRDCLVWIVRYLDGNAWVDLAIDDGDG